jgi:hypothetical protein
VTPADASTALQSYFMVLLAPHLHAQADITVTCSSGGFFPVVIYEANNQKLDDILQLHCTPVSFFSALFFCV